MTAAAHHLRATTSYLITVMQDARALFVVVLTRESRRRFSDCPDFRIEWSFLTSPVHTKFFGLDFYRLGVEVEPTRSPSHEAKPTRGGHEHDDGVH